MARSAAGAGGRAIAIGLRGASWRVRVPGRRAMLERYGAVFAVHLACQAALGQLGVSEASRARDAPRREGRIRAPEDTPLVSGIAAVVLGAITIATDSSAGLAAAGLAAVIGGVVATGSARKSGFGVQVAMSEPAESRLLHAIFRMRQHRHIARPRWLAS